MNINIERIKFKNIKINCRRKQQHDYETLFFLFFYCLPVRAFLLKVLQLYLNPWKFATFLKSTLPTFPVIAWKGISSLRNVRKPLAATGRYFPSTTPLVSFPFSYILSIRRFFFFLRNQSTKGIRSSGMVKKQVVCILHIVGHCIYCRHPTLLHYFSSYYPRTVALVTSTQYFNSLINFPLYI